MLSPTRQKAVLAIGQVLVTIALVLYVLRYADVSKDLKHLVSSGTVPFLICLALSAAQVVLLVVRWRAILACMDLVLPSSYLTRGVLVERFFSQILPTSFGGDAARGAYIIAAGADPGASIASIIFDRVAGLVGLVMLAGILAGVVVFAIAPLPPAELTIGLAISVMIMMGGAAIASKRAVQGAFGDGALRPLKRLAIDGHGLLRNPRFYVGGIGLSVLIQLIFCVVLVVLAWAELDRNSLVGVALLSPVILLATVLPLTVGGWGTRESAAMLVFQMVGVDAGRSVDLSVQFGLMQLFVGIVSASVFVILGFFAKYTIRTLVSVK